MTLLSPPLEELDDYRLWFYVVPHYKMKEVKKSDLRWEVVRKDNRFSYVAVISKGEPEGMPVNRTHIGYRPRHELEARLDEVESAIEDHEAERSSLTRWCLLFAHSLNRLEDFAARHRAAAQTYDVEPLFALQAWAPENKLDELKAYTERQGLVLDVQEVEPSDTPPTLLQNSPQMAAGENLVTFYTTPGYWAWDPSSVVFISFVIFFAMILADVGYAALFGLILLLARGKLRRTPEGCRLRTLGLALTGSTVVYGILVGSYFGLAPPPGSLLETLKIMDVEDTMTLSIIIGGIHVILGSVMDAYRMGLRPQALAPLGWAITVAALTVALASFLDPERDMSPALTIAVDGGVALGMGLVFLFNGTGKKIGGRLLAGLSAVPRIVNAFSDILSYLRLFALGMATASLALVFNDLAAQVHRALPGLGLLFALLILVIGHGLNFVLGLMSGVVHGLRLNVIEFFNWGLTEEGYLYHAFKRKENNPWNP